MRQFFEDSDGRLSTMRLCVFIVVVTACLIGVYSCIKEKNNAILVGTMLTAALTAKVAQRFKEN